ncbi:MAG: ABC transporter substrate-binding protein [Rhodoferax sp.]|nr:ABC transporter substrate-binding protein [Rhodoferax sp.]
MASTAWCTEITVYGGDSSPPKMYLQDGKNRGFLVDIVQYASAQMPVSELRVELYPWARAYRHATSGVGGIVGLSWTQERSLLFDYSEPVYIDEVVIVVRKDRPLAYKDLPDLQGKRIGIGRGGSYGEVFEKARDAGLFVIEGDNGPAERLNKLVLGRIDCALFNAGKAGFEELLRNHKDAAVLRETLMVLPVPLRSDPNYLAFPKSMLMKGWLGEFNQVIKRGYTRGDISKIIAANLRG